jgi:hypothetical protein
VEEYLVYQKVEEKAVIKPIQFGLVDFMLVTRLLLIFIVLRKGGLNE